MVSRTDLSGQTTETSNLEPVEVSPNEHETEIFYTMRAAVTRLQKEPGWPLSYSGFTKRMEKVKDGV